MSRRIALWLIRITVPLAAWLVISAVLTGRISELYRVHFADMRRERLFLASLAFFITFAIVRLLTHAIRAGEGPFHNLVVGGRHIHHMVYGISLLLVVGYTWLAQAGTGMPGTTPWPSRITSLLYGLASALTLDEFALWLNLKDVYWLPQGRESVKAVLLFGSLLSSTFWGAPFLHALGREAVRLIGGQG
jgi:hypothetical protein